MVNFGIVGFGLYAQKRLMPSFAISANCRVTALSRREQRAADQSARVYNIPHAFSSVSDLCRSEAVDAVFVTSPNSCHLPDVLTAIESGKPVLCEKPLGMNAAECRQMVEAAKQAGVLFGVAHVFRFNDSVNRIKYRLDAGELGKPVFARSEFSFHVSSDHPRTWINDPEIAGGGPIADVGVHCIDTLRYILQDEVLNVSAIGFSDDLSKELEAAAVVTLEFSRGTIGTVLASFRTQYRTPIEIIGDAGVLRADNALNVEFPITLERVSGCDVVEQEEVSNRFAYTNQVDAFAAAVEGKAKFPVPAEEGWLNQEILDAAYRSLKSGNKEKVNRPAALGSYYYSWADAGLGGIPSA